MNSMNSPCVKLSVEARKQVKEGKAPGEDGVMPELLKRINIDDIILKFANKLLLTGDLPEQFATVNILPIPKSGDVSCTSNYRSAHQKGLRTESPQQVRQNLEE